MTVGEQVRVEASIEQMARRARAAALASARLGAEQRREALVAMADAIDAHRSVARSPDAATARARNQVRRALDDLAWGRARGSSNWEATIESVASRQLDPISAAERLLGEG